MNIHIIYIGIKGRGNPIGQMKINENEKKLRIKLLIVATVAFAVLYSLYCFVIAPSYYAALYNIAYENTAVPDLLDYLGGIVEVLALSVFFALVFISSARSR